VRNRFRLSSNRLPAREEYRGGAGFNKGECHIGFALLQGSSPVGSEYYGNGGRAMRTLIGDSLTNGLPIEPVRW